LFRLVEVFLGQTEEAVQPVEHEHAEQVAREFLAGRGEQVAVTRVLLQDAVGGRAVGAVPGQADGPALLGEHRRQPHRGTAAEFGVAVLADNEHGRQGEEAGDGEMHEGFPFRCPVQADAADLFALPELVEVAGDVGGDLLVVVAGEPFAQDGTDHVAVTQTGAGT
jgi:hypothetical protein